MHLSDIETISLVKAAKNIGVKKFNVKFEFSYFFISSATNVPLTHFDGEKHKIQGSNENLLEVLIKTAGPKNVILSSDCGVSVLPKPHIGF